MTSSQTASEASSKVSTDVSPSIAALVRGWPARAEPSSPAPALSFSQAANACRTGPVTLCPPAHTTHNLVILDHSVGAVFHASAAVGLQAHMQDANSFIPPRADLLLARSALCIKLYWCSVLKIMYDTVWQTDLTNTQMLRQQVQGVTCYCMDCCSPLWWRQLAKTCKAVGAEAMISCCIARRLSGRTAGR